MFTFLRANFLIGLAWVLSPIILLWYVATLLVLIIFSLIGGNDIKSAIRAWAMMINVDLEWFVLVMKHGLVKSLKAYQEVKKES